MIIAVDFDGTIVEHRYPAIGKERPFAVATLRQLQKENPDLRLILWTVREGQLLKDAVDWCAARNLEFFAINSNYPDEPRPDMLDSCGCRKVTADIYIDDRSLGGLPEWPSIYRRLTSRNTGSSGSSRTSSQAPARRSFLARLFGK